MTREEKISGWRSIANSLRREHAAWHTATRAMVGSLVIGSRTEECDVPVSKKMREIILRDIEGRINMYEALIEEVGGSEP